MEETWICPGCLNEVGTEEGICPVCGFDKNACSRPEDALPLYTLAGDRYLIGAVIGRGGFGITYAAMDHKLKRKVAIKELFIRGITRRGPDGFGVLAEEGREEAFFSLQEAFLEEARILSGTEEEGAVRVLDCFQERGTSFLVMEYLEGETLQERIEKEGPMKEKEALSCIRILAGTLKNLHRKGILHLDISPENIMLTRDRGVRLIDFGLSRNLYAQVLGTMYSFKPGYAPPEQYVRGARLLPCADVYALGAVCLFALTGRRPDRPGPEEPEMSERTRHLLKKAMEPRPEDRYQTMEEMMEDMNKKHERKKIIWTALAAAIILGASGLWYVRGAGSRDAFLEKEEAVLEETEDGPEKETESGQEQPPAMQEGDLMPGISGLFNISCVTEGNLLFSVSQDPGLAEPEIIVWERVWDETQEFYVEDCTEDLGGYRIYPLWENGDFAVCLTLEKETGRILVREKDPEDPCQIFRLVYAGGDRMKIQGADGRILSAGTGAGNGTGVLACPEGEEGTEGEWMLEFPR